MVAKYTQDRKRQPVEGLYLVHYHSFLRTAQAVLCRVSRAFDAEDVVQEAIVEVLERSGPAAADDKERSPRKGNTEVELAAFRQLVSWRAIDIVRRERKVISLESLQCPIDGEEVEPSVDDVLARVTRGSAFAASAEDEFFTIDAAELHREVSTWFRQRAARALTAAPGKRHLSSGSRPAIIEALLERPSLLATLVGGGRRDTYAGASQEAARLADETGLTVGRVRNLRTELMDILRKELAPEIEFALAVLAERLGTTRREAAELHARWAEGLA